MLWRAEEKRTCDGRIATREDLTTGGTETHRGNQPRIFADEHGSVSLNQKRNLTTKDTKVHKGNPTTIMIWFCGLRGIRRVARRRRL